MRRPIDVLTRSMWKNLRELVQRDPADRPPVFAYLHLLPPHDPYFPGPDHDLFGPEGYDGPVIGHGPDIQAFDTGRLSADSPDQARLESLYDGGLRRGDALMARALEAWDALGRSRPRLLIVLSDHGEAFGEHGREGHARDVYGEVTTTPFILSLPFRLEPGVVAKRGDVDPRLARPPEGEQGVGQGDGEEELELRAKYIDEAFLDVTEHLGEFDSATAIAGEREFKGRYLIAADGTTRTEPRTYLEDPVAHLDRRIGNEAHPMNTCERRAALPRCPLAPLTIPELDLAPHVAELELEHRLGLRRIRALRTRGLERAAIELAKSADQSRVLFPRNRLLDAHHRAAGGSGSRG